jgi:hypothetical protein
MEQVNEADELKLGMPPQPITETKGEAFERLATARVNRALDAIRLVGNLANRSSYDYDADDVADIMHALRLALADIEGRFRVNSPQEAFRLKR